MHYLLGDALKKQYPKLLTKYDPDRIYARSTDVNRTIMSVYSHLYGIFQENGPDLGPKIIPEEAIPPFQSEIIQQTVKTLDNSFALPRNIQPVPVHVTTEVHDYVLRPWSGCALANKWYMDSTVDQEALSMYQNDMKDTVSYFNNKGIKLTNLMDLYSIADNTITNKFQGISLPGDITLDSKEFKDLNFVAEWFTIKSVELSDTQISLYAIGLLNTIYDFMNGKVNGTNVLDFVFLSGHDTTLLTLLIPFGITNKNCFRENYLSQKEGKELPYPECKFPIYASNLIFELYKTEEPYIVFKYNGNPVPFCGKDQNQCTLKEFASYIKKLTKGYTMNDYQTMCSLPSNNEKTYLWLIVLSVVCVALAVGLIAIRKNLELKEKELDVQPTQGGEYYLGK